MGMFKQFRDWRYDLVLGAATAHTAKHMTIVYRTVVWLPFAASLMWACVLCFSQQARHAYLALIERNDLVHGGMGLAAVLILCAIISGWHGRLIAARIENVYPEHADPDFCQRLNLLRDVQTFTSGLLPLAGLTAGLSLLYVETASVEDLLRKVGGLHAAAAGLPDIPRDGVQDISHSVLGTFAGAAGATAFAAIVLYGLRRWVGPALRRYGAGAGFAIALLVAIVPFFAKGSTVELAIVLGPLAMGALVMIAVTMAVVFFARYPVALIWPVLSFGLLLAGVRIGDGPELGRLREGVPAAGCTMGDCRRPALTRAFDEWLKDRQPHASAQSRYPVFIVAVEGGGIYAASAAAKLLTTLQDHCPQFAQHVFAVSAVSGGAIGASIFNALNPGPLVADGGKACAPLAARATGRQAKVAGEIISADHLSGPLAFIVPDALRKFDFGIAGLLTGGIHHLAAAAEGAVTATNRSVDCVRRQSLFDRALALERSFAVAFDGAAGSRPAIADCGSPPKTGLSSAFYPQVASPSAAPGLVLNTTWVERGYRVTFAPFRMRDPDHLVGDGTLFDFTDLGIWDETHRPISLIRAAGASARFPGLMPAAAVDFLPARPAVSGPHKGAARWNFVDGGYADASGATTAFDILEALERHIKTSGRAVDLRLVLLTDADTTLDLPSIDGSGLKDSFVIAHAVLNVRQLLTQRAVTAALSQTAALDPALPAKVMAIRLIDPALPLPLGWRISRRMDELVQYLLGDAVFSVKGCSTAPPVLATAAPTDAERIAATIRANSCVQRTILELLAR